MVACFGIPADDALEAEILAYLAEHPHAMDTLGGIAEWWIERHRIRVGVDALSRALARLADKGVLEIVSGPHDPLYRLRDRVRPAEQ